MKLKRELKDPHFYPNKILDNRIGKIYTSFSLNEYKDLKVNFMLSHSLEKARKKGVCILLTKNNDQYIKSIKIRLAKKQRCQNKT